MSRLALVVFVSFLVEAAAGFGSMVVALTLGAVWFEVDALMVWLVPVNMVLSAWLVLRELPFVKWRFLGTLAPLMGVGLAGGTFVARWLGDGGALKATFGLFVVVIASWQLLRAEPRAFSLSVRVPLLLLAGVVHGVFATGGPLAVFVSANALPDKRSFRGTLSMLWLALNALVLLRLPLTNASLQTSALMLVPLSLGIAGGELLHRRIDERRFRAVVSALLLIAGAVLTVTSLQKALHPA